LVFKVKSHTKPFTELYPGSGRATREEWNVLKAWKGKPQTGVNHASKMFLPKGGYSALCGKLGSERLAKAFLSRLEPGDYHFLVERAKAVELAKAELAGFEGRRVANAVPVDANKRLSEAEAQYHGCINLLLDKLSGKGG